MSETAPKTVRGHCPGCRGERVSFVRGEYVHRWHDDTVPIDGSTTCFILECRGCESIYYRRDEYFSEHGYMYRHPITGNEEYDPNVTTTYWPSPLRRPRPEWICEFHHDTVLPSLLNELYCALDSDLKVLSAIAIRTVFDRSTELLNIRAEICFARKLNELMSSGKISKEERNTLAVLVDAGSAAAHRGWKPSSANINVMMDLLESFLHRSFILGEGIAKLKQVVPAKPRPPK